jgi:hypothetical protein
MGRRKLFGKKLNKVVPVVPVVEDIGSAIETATEAAADLVDMPDMGDVKEFATDIKTLAEKTMGLTQNSAAKGLELVDIEVKDEAGEVVSGTNKLKLHQLLDRSVGECANNILKLPFICRDFFRSDEFKLAQDLALNMDDFMLQAMNAAVELIEDIEEGWNDLPDVIKAVANAVGEEPPPMPPADTSGDVEALVQAKVAFEALDIPSIVTNTSEAFVCVRAKYDVVKFLCEAMVSFCVSVIGMADALLGLDVGEMIDCFREISRCLKLSKIMKQYADEIKKVTIVIVELLKAMFEKIDGLELPDIPSVEEAVEAVEEVAEAAVDGAKKALKKLKF